MAGAGEGRRKRGLGGGERGRGDQNSLLEENTKLHNEVADLKRRLTRAQKECGRLRGGTAALASRQFGAVCSQLRQGGGPAPPGGALASGGAEEDKRVLLVTAALLLRSEVEAWLAENGNHHGYPTLQQLVAFAAAGGRDLAEEGWAAMPEKARAFFAALLLCGDAHQPRVAPAGAVTAAGAEKVEEPRQRRYGCVEVFRQTRLAALLAFGGICKAISAAQKKNFALPLLCGLAIQVYADTGSERVLQLLQALGLGFPSYDYVVNQWKQADTGKVWEQGLGRLGLRESSDGESSDGESSDVLDLVVSFDNWQMLLSYGTARSYGGSLEDVKMDISTAFQLCVLPTQLQTRFNYRPAVWFHPFLKAKSKADVRAAVRLTEEEEGVHAAFADVKMLNALAVEAYRRLLAQGGGGGGGDGTPGTPPPAPMPPTRPGAVRATQTVVYTTADGRLESREEPVPGGAGSRRPVRNMLLDDPMLPEEMRTEPEAPAPPIVPPAVPVNPASAESVDELVAKAGKAFGAATDSPGEQRREFLFFVTDGGPGTIILNRLLQKDPAYEFVFLLPGLFHVFMWALVAVRGIYFPLGGSLFAWIHGYRTEAHQKFFSSAKDTHKATEAVELEVEGAERAFARLYFLSADGQGWEERCGLAAGAPDPAALGSTEAYRQIRAKLVSELPRFKAWKDVRAGWDETFAAMRSCYRDAFLPTLMLKAAARENSLVHLTAALKLLAPLWLSGPKAHRKTANIVGYFLLMIHRLRNPIAGKPNDTERCEAILAALRDHVLHAPGTPGVGLHRDESIEFLMKDLISACPRPTHESMVATSALYEELKRLKTVTDESLNLPPRDARARTSLRALQELDVQEFAERVFRDLEARETEREALEEDDPRRAWLPLEVKDVAPILKANGAQPKPQEVVLQSGLYAKAGGAEGDVRARGSAEFVDRVHSCVCQASGGEIAETMQGGLHFGTYRPKAAPQPAQPAPPPQPAQEEAEFPDGTVVEVLWEAEGAPGVVQGRCPPARRGQRVPDRLPGLPPGRRAGRGGHRPEAGRRAPRPAGRRRGRRGVAPAVGWATSCTCTELLVHLDVTRLSILQKGGVRPVRERPVPVPAGPATATPA